MDAQKEKEYYNRINYLLLDSIPKNCECIVEVGCGTGALGFEYMKNNPACSYIGVEVNSSAAESAEQKLTKVIVGDIEKLDLSGLIERRIDCLVYGDVLEHLVDPWRVIGKHASLLQNNGCMIACIPNVENWEVLVKLLRGKWEYESEGVLDQTHLRFFTIDTIIKMFLDKGLKINSIRTTTRRMGNDFLSFKSLIEPVIVRMGIDSRTFFHRVSTLQYVVTATKKP